MATNRQKQAVKSMSRKEVISGLESIGIACYDDESTSLLKEAYLDSVDAGDLHA